jgi:DNA excision repair protein ERCC-3
MDHSPPGGVCVLKGLKMKASSMDALVGMESGFHVNACVRSYQEDAVAAACDTAGGILCLPCGAGKTMIGILLSARRGGDTLFFCNTNEIVSQVTEHLRNYTDINEGHVLKLTATHKARIQQYDTPIVMVTTYAMMASRTGRTSATRVCMDAIMSHRWRTIILDEVHCAAAAAASACWRRISADAKFGLTATLVRADSGVDNLLRDVGPRLYEMGWRHLEGSGFTAAVDPVVVFCELPTSWT